MYSPPAVALIVVALIGFMGALYKAQRSALATIQSAAITAKAKLDAEALKSEHAHQELIAQRENKFNERMDAEFLKMQKERDECRKMQDAANERHKESARRIDALEAQVLVLIKSLELAETAKELAYSAMRESQIKLATLKQQHEELKATVEGKGKRKETYDVHLHSEPAPDEVQ